MVSAKTKTPLHLRYLQSLASSSSNISSFTDTDSPPSQISANESAYSLPSSRSSSHSPSRPRSTQPSFTPSLFCTLTSASTTAPSTASILEPESVLAIVTDGKYVFAGTQGVDIGVWSLGNLEAVGLLRGHESSVLCLELAKEMKWLFSGSGDNTIRIWDTVKLECVHRVEPPHYNIGDILSLSYIPPSHLPPSARSDTGTEGEPSGGRLYFGNQDCSIIWLDLPSRSSPSPSSPSESRDSHPPTPSGSSHGQTEKKHKFFDSLSSGERMRASILASAETKGERGRKKLGVVVEPVGEEEEEVGRLDIEEGNVVSYAHFGYVYCLATGMLAGGLVLVSAGGDEDIKIWSLKRTEMKLLVTLSGRADAVMSLAIVESTLYAGHQGGIIKVWDLETMTCIRTLKGHKDDVLSLSVVGRELFSASANGQVVRWSPSLNKVASWVAHDGRALSIASLVDDGRNVLFTGGSDNCVKVWDLVVEEEGEVESPEYRFHGRMFKTLSNLVSYASISDGEHKEECRQAALYLRRLLGELGAESVLLPVHGRNPLVLAKFHPRLESQEPQMDGVAEPKRVLFYGHYDTFSTGNMEQWSSDPFRLTGRNGFLYGRGVSDNKGPIIAVAYAVASLLREKKLDVEFIMLLEGEEENGSIGFQEAVRQHKNLIADQVDVVLVSNSSWLSDDIPCMTYGLRGVIHLSLSVVSDNPDLHSGMHGGVVREPLLELVHLLSTLTTPSGRVLVPNFYDGIRPLSAEEEKHYDDILRRSSRETISKLLENSDTLDPKEALSKRWRLPALSVHKVEMTGLAQTIIPGQACASLSVRIVPDQKLDTVVGAIKGMLEDSYRLMGGKNRLEVTIKQAADWWLGSFASASALSFARCIKDEWGGGERMDPLWIREGGSIPSIPFLEREFGAEISIHFPMGMGSDKAHLANERIRMSNLEKGMKVVMRWLEDGKVASV
ncbi:Zn-dependent exopeptidase [Atractiella rhizophila]|nr:Zn-dependent exopeptidase [Atractiella rhizophila]